MNKKSKLEVRKLRKEVVNKTMEELKILKSKTDEIFQVLLYSKEHFEELFESEKALYKEGKIHKEDKIGDCYLTEYIGIVFSGIIFRRVWL